MPFVMYVINFFFKVIHTEHDHTLKLNEKSTKENKEKLNIISQLEQV